MFIDANKILELIEIAHECDRKLPEEEKKIHVLDIAATLQKLIDDETAHLNKMAEEFAAREQAEQDEAEAAANEMMEAAAAVMDWAQQEKAMDDETRKMQDWPGGV